MTISILLSRTATQPGEQAGRIWDRGCLTGKSVSVSADVASLPGSKVRENRLLRRSDFVSRFKQIGFGSFRHEIFVFTKNRNYAFLSSPRSDQRGVSRSS